MIEDEEPLYIERADAPNETTMSMCLIGKLWTNRSFNVFGLMEAMKKIWSPLQGMTCRDMGCNMVSFQFNSQRDMDKVLAMEPWHSNKQVLVLKRLTDET